MTIFFFNNKDYQKEVIFFIILYFTLIISFFFGEDSTGGAFKDYANQKTAVQSFATQFLNTFYEYDSFQTSHSPILMMFLSLFKKINLADTLTRLIHLHICLLLPFFFYKCLTVKFNKIDRNFGGLSVRTK